MNGSFESEQIRQLRARVAKLERIVAFLLEKLNLEYVDNPAADIDPEVFRLARAGKTIDAIKLYRQKTGADLAEAKALVESLGG